MYDRLQAVEDRYDELNELLSDPDVVSDPKRLRDLSKEQSGITATVETYREYKNVNEQINETKELLGEKLDDEMREMAKEEFAELQKEKADLEERLKLLLVPKDPNDDKNVILEIRGAAGGDEAALFAGDLFRMYSKYAESRGWKVEIMDANPTGIGGYKEIIAMMNGNDAFSRMKYENGRTVFNVYQKQNQAVESIHQQRQ